MIYTGINSNSIHHDSKSLNAIDIFFITSTTKNVRTFPKVGRDKVLKSRGWNQNKNGHNFVKKLERDTINLCRWTL